MNRLVVSGCCSVSSFALHSNKFYSGAAYPRFHPDPPVRALYLASVGGGGPVNLVLLGPTLASMKSAFGDCRFARVWHPCFGPAVFCAHDPVATSSARPSLRRPVPKFVSPLEACVAAMRRSRAPWQHQAMGGVT